MSLFKPLSIPNPNRIFGLDVLRAFAIVTVMVGHSYHLVSPAWQPYYELLWFDGVAIFFVLSGFLIGRLLLKTLQHRPATWPVLVHFWGRRWLRTIPAYLVVLSLLVLLQASKPTFRITHYKAYYLFLQNLNWPQPGFFPEAWSLSVEEWFYLLLPSSLFLLLAARLRLRTAMAVTSLGVIVLVTLYRLYTFEQVPPHTVDKLNVHLRSIVLLRLDAPMYGVLGACLAHYFPSFWQRYKLVGLGLGIALLSFLTFTFEDQNPSSRYMVVFYWSWLALAVLLLLPFLSAWKTASGFVPRVVTQVSILSYSLYLVHSSLLLWTLIMPNLAYLPGSPATEKALGLVAFWVLSWGGARILYTYVELPFIHLRARLKSLLPRKTVTA